MDNKEILVNTGLDWNVRTEKTQTLSGIELENKVALIREDNNKVLGLHSDSYGVYQNSQLVDLIQRVSSSTGLDIHKGGEFSGGKKVYIQLKSDNLTIGNDRVEGFVTGINSFDGSTSLAFGNSNLTISCTNTFFAAMRNLSKIRHTKNIELRVDDICRGVDKLIDDEKVMFEKIKRMSETGMGTVSNVNNDITNRVVQQLFDVNMDVDLNNYLNSDMLSTTKKNRISRFYVDLNGELKQKGDNLWGLFSGVTKYTTHSLSKTDNSEKKLFGLYGKKERQIFQDISSLVY